MTSPPDVADRFIPLPDVMDRVGLKKTKIYGLIRVGEFPAPIKQGSASRWSESEIAQYQAKKKKAKTNGDA